MRVDKKLWLQVHIRLWLEILSKITLADVGPVVSLFQKAFKLLDIPFCLLWVYLMKKYNLQENYYFHEKK